MSKKAIIKANSEADDEIEVILSGALLDVLEADFASVKSVVEDDIWEFETEVTTDPEVVLTNIVTVEDPDDLEEVKRDLIDGFSELGYLTE